MIQLRLQVLNNVLRKRICVICNVICNQISERVLEKFQMERISLHCRPFVK